MKSIVTQKGVNSMLLLVDTSNLYFCTNKRFPGQKIDYAKYVDNVLKDFGDIDQPIAYVSQSKNEGIGFMKYLKAVGFDVVVKRPYRKKVHNDYIFYTNWNAEMAYATAKAQPTVIGSSAVEIYPVLEHLYKQTQVYVYASGIPESFKNVTTSVREIEADIMKDAKLSSE